MRGVGYVFIVPTHGGEGVPVSRAEAEVAISVTEEIALATPLDVAAPVAAATGGMSNIIF